MTSLFKNCEYIFLRTGKKIGIGRQSYNHIGTNSVGDIVIAGT
jgi:hypothetical protein